ncbi:hypothetical protein K1T71_005486 [Dendrolimus kikuchii]|uniref:Uncharacterized protein n=1 Tax=Dendrolimus kikuchii TaxID=765133 RepID=A0ACC1D417_9NEOP|nr:hypothetical protein K1T71_005486 [Dendrolimus kikuchii]
MRSTLINGRFDILYYPFSANQMYSYILESRIIVLILYLKLKLERNCINYFSTNLVGKFTQSVRRIVQDVKDEGTSSGQTKEEVIETNERLRAVRVRLDENYDTAKKALVTLMARYSESKAQRNVFTRYALLKAMIKDVIRLETQYWSLVEIPRQEKAETVPAFVLRACAIMEKTQKSGEGVKTSSKLAEEAADRRERIERLNDMTTSQIETENTQMTNDLYRLLKKYTGLRNLIRELKSEYVSSKVYPMFPRYTMLKDMIKDIMHDPDYMEVCHEVDP